jgi:hypothetical protein
MYLGQKQNDNQVQRYTKQVHHGGTGFFRDVLSSQSSDRLMVGNQIHQQIQIINNQIDHLTGKYNPQHVSNKLNDQKFHPTSLNK